MDAAADVAGGDYPVRSWHRYQVLRAWNSANKPDVAGRLAAARLLGAGGQRGDAQPQRGENDSSFHMSPPNLRPLYMVGQVGRVGQGRQGGSGKAGPGGE